MQTKRNLKMAPKVIILAIAAALVLSIYPVARAEDYPAGYIGPGHRDYLNGKILSGYYVDLFSRADLRQKERVSKRNQVEEILNYSYQAGPESANGTFDAKNTRSYNSYGLKMEIARQRQQREQVASAQTEFNYIRNTDGKVSYFKDGLTTRIENERITDEFGNVSAIKNTRNMQYNDKRLLIGYDADVMDKLGNTSKVTWYGVKYTPDSVFYGSSETRANKNISEYYLKEVDPAGNATETHFYGTAFEGKFLRAFSQTVEDTIRGKASFNRSNIQYSDPNHVTGYHEEGTGTDNKAYTSDRTNMAYDDDRLSSYDEVTYTTQVDGLKQKTTVNAKFTYKDTNQFGPDVPSGDSRLVESVITSTVENPDGSIRTDTTTTTYEYDALDQITGATAYNEFHGQDAKGLEYKDAEGHILTRNTDAEGEITYSYVDADGKTVTVDEDKVTKTAIDGEKFSGNAVTTTQFEILGGKLMTKEVRAITTYNTPDGQEIYTINDTMVTYNNGLVNNMARVLDTKEHSEITYPLFNEAEEHTQIRDIATTYEYDAKGNLSDASSTGTGSGWEYSGEKGWYAPYTSTITSDYEIILGGAVQKTYDEEKIYDYANNATE